MVVLQGCDACVHAADVFAAMQLVQSVAMLAAMVLRMWDSRNHEEEDGADPSLAHVVDFYVRASDVTYCERIVVPEHLQAQLTEENARLTCCPWRCMGFSQACPSTKT
jgi:hypothetical protein